MLVKKLMITGLVAFLAASVGVLSMLLTQSEPPRPPEEKPLPEAVIVFCFHGKDSDVKGKKKDYRAKCEKIEKYTHEVLEKSFANQLKDETLVWQVLDYESPKNASWVRDFMVKKTCIVVGDARPDGSGMATNLEKKVWELVDKKEDFQKFIQREVKKVFDPSTEEEPEKKPASEAETKTPEPKADSQTSESEKDGKDSDSKKDSKASDSKKDSKASDLKKEEPTPFPKMGSEAIPFDPDAPQLPHEANKQTPATDTKKQEPAPDAAKKTPAAKTTKQKSATDAVPKTPASKKTKHTPAAEMAKPTPISEAPKKTEK